MTGNRNSFGARSALQAGGRSLEFFRLEAVTESGLGDIERLPFSMRVLLENLLRHEDGTTVTQDDIRAVARWDPRAEPSREIAYRPARVLLQDFTGVPAVVDLAAMREALADMGGDPKCINPLQPADLVIDHSVQVDAHGSPDAFAENLRLEFERNGERYELLKWAQNAFQGFRVVPPSTGIVHQVNLEYLAPVVYVQQEAGNAMAYPDTLVGTDSHTTMINGLGVLGWGVGGIEAEAAMLGQPISMLLPQVVGFELTGRLRKGVTATDLVLTVVQMLRQRVVVGKFVEFFGEGLDGLSLADRATLANMAPETGATVCFFPVDRETLSYLRLTGRDAGQIELVERYCREQRLFRSGATAQPRYSEALKLDLGSVVPSIAGPRRPQDRLDLGGAKSSWRDALSEMTRNAPDAVRGQPDGASPQCESDAYEGFGADDTAKRVPGVEPSSQVQHGSVVIAAITSCTNTSNPAVLMAAGLLAKNAVQKGLSTKPWVKASLAPGSQVVTDYLHDAELMPALQQLGFHLVAYGCTTCIGNSGPLSAPVVCAIERGNLAAVSVLSGNRNFEGRINQHVRANYLASPPLVVAYALSGTMDIDFENEPLGVDRKGQPVFLREIWPSHQDVERAVQRSVKSEMFVRRYSGVFEGSERWRSVQVSSGSTYTWDPASTYIRRPPFFDRVSVGPIPPPQDICAARVLAVLGDSVTTDHISPAGAIAPDSPAGRYLQERGVRPLDFNSYGSRRGNHEVMMRGTFANIRLRNLLLPGSEGGVTRFLPEGRQMTIYDAAVKYQNAGVPLVVLAGREYGSGSSRDWAAKGTLLLGVRAVIAQSFERIHRSNLVGMGVMPLEFLPGDSCESVGLTGEEPISISGIAGGLAPRKRLRVQAGDKSFEVIARLDTPHEVEYFVQGGMLQHVLRRLAKRDHG